MTGEEARAREAIRHRLNRLQIAGDRQDAALFIAQFAEGASFELVARPPLPGFKAKGLEGIRAMTGNWQHLPKVNLVRHNLTTCDIVLTGPDTASVVSYFMVASDRGLDHGGTYDDRMVLSGADWLFLSRRVNTEWATPDSLFFPPT